MFQEEIESGFVSWRDTEYLKRWEQTILFKLGHIFPSSYCDADDIEGDDDGLPKVELEDPVCIKFKKTNTNTDAPVKKVRESRQYCDSCDFVAKRDRPFQRHQFEDHGRSLCGECGRHFSDFRTFYKHIVTHYEQVICPHCPKQFPTTSRLNDHINIHHVGNEKKRRWVERQKVTKPCPLCGDLIQSGNLTNHIKQRHTAPSNCPHCGKIVKILKDHIERTKCNLPLEQRVHEIVSCQFCNKQIQKYSLKNHIKKFHSSIGELQCDMCEFKTKHPFNLAAHKKRMHEHRALKEICPKCKKSSHNLEWHLSVYHTDEI